ncbi:MAG: hypothetical protein NTV01_05695 [Bacteroidia bacterium]|nr:hypothetical protein [Bacteroidia bacterium]
MPRFIILDGQRCRDSIENVLSRVVMPPGVEVLYGGQKAFLAGGYHYNSDELRLIAGVLDEITKEIDHAVETGNTSGNH